MAAPDRTRCSAALFVTAVAGIAAALISLSFEASRERIAENRRTRLHAQLEEVLGGQDYSNDLAASLRTVVAPELLGSPEPLDVYTAMVGGAVTAVVLTAIAPHGYSGAIELLVGIDADGRVTGVRATDHRETPGLGDAIDIDRSSWIDGFAAASLENPSLSDWRVTKDGGTFDSITGATVTPRAVTEAVKNALIYFREHRDELLDARATEATADAQ